MLFQTDSAVLKHWKVKEVIIQMDKEYSFLCDDSAQTATELRIEVSPQSLNVLIPDTIKHNDKED
jgi:diacylglycerol kinase (ATP)